MSHHPDEWVGNSLLDQQKDPNYFNHSDDKLCEVITATEYNYEKLNALMNIIPNTGSVVDIKILSDIARTWGARIDKMRICSTLKHDENVRHMIGLIMMAKSLKKDGFKIHLVESTNAAGERVYRDVDCVASLDNNLYFFDYSNSTAEHEDFNGEIRVYHRHSKLMRKKYKILEEKTDTVHNSMVVTMKEKIVYSVTLTCPSDDEGPYLDSFTKASKLVDMAKDFTRKDVNSLIEESANRLKEIELERGLITTYSGLPAVYNPLQVRKCLEYNNPMSVKYYLEVMEALRDGRSDIARDDYSLKFHRNIEVKEVKPTTYVPLMEKREYNTKGLTMVERAVLLRDSLLSKGCELPVMTLALSLCVDNSEHPTRCERIQWANKVIDPRWGEFLMRLTKEKSKNTLRSFVEVRFTKSYYSGLDFTYGSGCGPGSVYTRYWNQTVETEDIQMSNYESALSTLGHQLGQSHSVGDFSMTLDKLIGDSMNSTEVGQTMRDSADVTMRKVATSNIMDWAEGNQMYCESITTMAQKSKHYSRSRGSSISGNTMRFFVDEIGDRNALLFSSSSYVSSSANDCVGVIEGQLRSVDTRGLMIGKHYESTTRWFNLSRSNLDWGITSYTKTLTYFTMISDIYLTLKPKRHQMDSMDRDLAMGLGLMISNNTKFSQVSGQIRHLFNNCAGISNGTKDLYEKMSWYTPSSFIEKIYCMRMHKMTTMMQLLKSNHNIGVAIDPFSSIRYEGSRKVGIEKNAWIVAMPANTISLPTDQSLYSSFYTSYAFASARYNLTFMQSQVFVKQIESRRKFVVYRDNPRQTDLENIDLPKNSIELLENMKESLFMDTNGGQHKPCHYTVILGALTSLFELHKNESTIREVIEKHYTSVNQLHNVTVSSAANNRSSVTVRGIGGILPPRITKHRIVRGETRIVKTVVENQTAKNYETLLMSMNSFMKDLSGEEHKDLGIPVSESEYSAKPELTSDMIVGLLDSPTSLWPTLFYNLCTNQAIIARMIHKDDQKPREIAIMNAHLRLIALFIEEMAREIQHIENNNGDFTNLIERSDKDGRSTSTYLEYKGKRRNGKIFMSDNEDKSGWGPSQDPLTLFITSQFRIKDSFVANVYKNMFQKYTRKQFKAPDHLVLRANSYLIAPIGNDVVSNAIKIIKSGETSVYDCERESIYSCEGMFQGTLSVMSSCSAADCFRLGIKINSIILADNDYDSKGHVTSDDAVRAMSFRENTLSVTQILKKSLSAHNEISKNYSYKRNMSCSVHSSYVYELNSIFHTSDGKIIPSIKSRLSFVTYSHELDMYQSAISVMTRASEYIRLEGSTMGSLWIFLLNTFNHMRQFQLTGLYNKIGDKIFKVPLELGGLPKIDPLMSVSASPLSNLVDNYGGSFPQAISILTNSYLVPQTITTDITKEERDVLKLRKDIPRLTRNSVTNLVMRECKDKRKIRETVMSLPRSVFTSLAYPMPSVLKMLITCFSREGVYYSESSIATRFSQPQTPYEAKVYYIKSELFKGFFDTRISRKDMHDFCEEVQFVGKSMSTTKYITPIPDSYPEVAEQMRMKHVNYANEMNNLRVFSIIPHFKHSYVTKVPESFIEFPEIDKQVILFEDKHRPTELGGDTDIHPVLYFETSSSYRSKLRKFLTRKQRFKFSSLEGNKDKSVAYKLLASDFIEGSRIDFHDSKEVPKVVRNKLPNFVRFLKNRLNNSVVRKNEVMSLESLVNTNDYFSKVDITGLICYHTRESTEYWGGTTRINSVLQLLKDTSPPNGIETKKGIMNFFIKVPLPLSESPIMFYHDDIYIEQGPMVRRQANSHSIVTVKIKDIYVHYITLWSGKYELPLDTAVDNYELEDLSEFNHVQVKLESFMGIKVVKYRDHIVMAIDRDINRMGKKVLISQNDSALITHTLIEKYYYAIDAFKKEHLYDYSILRAGLEVPEVDLVENDMMDLMQGELVYESDESEYDMANFNINLVKEIPLDDDEDYDLRAILPVADDIEDEHEEEENIHEVISGSRDDPMVSDSNFQRLIILNGIKKVEPKIRRHLKKTRIKLKLNSWTVQMPLSFLPSGNQLDVDEDALMNLLDLAYEHYNGDTIEFLWFKYYIFNSLIVMPGGKHKISKIIQDISDEREGVEDNVDLSDLVL